MEIIKSIVFIHNFLRKVFTNIYKVTHHQTESLTDPGLWLEVVVGPWPEAEVAGSRLAAAVVVVAARWPESIPRQGPRPFLGQTVGASVLKNMKRSYVYFKTTTKRISPAKRLRIIWRSWLT